MEGSKKPKPVRGKPREKSISDGIIATPQQARFAAELALNGGNATAAARSVGLSESYGRQLASRNVAVREALEYIKERNLGRAIVWTDLVPVAQAELFDLMTGSENDMVRLHAARLIIENAEGKPVSRTEALVTHRNDQMSVDPQTFKWAINMYVRTGKPLAQLLEEAKKNPVMVREWVKEHAPRLVAGSVTVTTPDSNPSDTYTKQLTDQGTEGIDWSYTNDTDANTTEPDCSEPDESAQIPPDHAL
jgi:hypothetical protein